MRLDISTPRAGGGAAGQAARGWPGQDHREINVYFRRQEGGRPREGEAEGEGEEKEIKLWYRDLLNAGGGRRGRRGGGTQRRTDGRTGGRQVHPIGGGGALPSASALRGLGTCNQRVLANDSNQFVVFPSREPTNERTDEPNGGGYEL